MDFLESPIYSDRSTRILDQVDPVGGRMRDPGIFNRTSKPVQGTIYLLHFDRPLGHARHYCGWTSDLPARLARHAQGQGARLLQVARERGITWTLAATWPGTRADERARKGRGSAVKYCPICRAEKKEQTAKKIY